MGRKIFFRNIFKTLRGVGHYIVYIILKTFFNMPIGLVVAASLPLHSSLILVLYVSSKKAISLSQNRILSFFFIRSRQSKFFSRGNFGDEIFQVQICCKDLIWKILGFDKSDNCELRYTWYQKLILTIVELLFLFSDT